MKTQNLQNFGMVIPGANVRVTPFSAFSKATYSGTPVYNFFTGGISANQNLSFPNTDDQIYEIKEIGLTGDLKSHLMEFTSSTYFTISKNDSIIYKVPLVELAADVDFKFSTLTGWVIKTETAFKKLLNPILVNGNENIKISIYCNQSFSPVVFLRGVKYAKTNSFIYDERKGKNLNRNDYSMFHYKSLVTGSNSLFASESNENNFSKLFPLASKESFILNAVEISQGAGGTLTSANITTAVSEIMDTTNILRVIINNVEVLNTNDPAMFSYSFYNAGPDPVDRRIKHGTFILPTPIVFPAAANVQIYFNSVARTYSSASNLFIFKGELIKEVS